MEKVIITTFTDPMMGLIYESEPIMDRLQKEYGDKIEFQNVMGLLARERAKNLSEDCLTTTHFEIILKVVREAGIDEKSFTRYYQNGSAEAALNEDLAFASRLGIHSLPAYLIQYKDRALLMQSFEYQDFIEAINRIIAH